MKQFSDITAQRPKQPSDSEHEILLKLSKFVKGEKVRGDDLVKAGLWLVAEVARRIETPSFRRERLREWFETTGKLARKQIHLVQGWPGLDVNPQGVEERHQVLNLFDRLTKLAPDREDCCD
jgi:hypothetical protein